MSTVIEAERRRVWRALTDPRELVIWDRQLVAPIDAVPTTPHAGQHVRWRCRLGSAQLVMHECTGEVSPPERLGSTLSFGALSFHRTWTLAPDPAVDIHTRLTMKLSTSNTVAVMGDVIDRFSLRRIAAERIADSLAGVRKHCERERRRALGRQVFAATAG